MATLRTTFFATFLAAFLTTYLATFHAAFLASFLSTCRTRFLTTSLTTLVRSRFRILWKCYYFPGEINVVVKVYCKTTVGRACGL